MATAEGAAPVSLRKELKGVSPWMDAWKLFRRNRAAMIALVTIIIIFFIALTASLWTKVGLLDNRHILLVPSAALVVTTLAFNFLGDGLRDALDPRLRGTH